ncbi:MAG: hypothetical protein IKO22_04990 [Oscillospiraceae bacterium]|nr:hypothetical protein [Oscillospiraceae bacterium]
MLEIIISSSVLILVIVLLRFLLKGKISARLQYALWLTVLVRLLLPVSLFPSPLSVAEAAAPVTAQMEEASYTILYTRPSSEPADAEPSPTAPRSGDTAPVAPARAVFLRDVLRGVWRAGMALMAGWFLTVNLRLYRRLKKNRRLYDDSCPLPVYVTENIPSPCLFGGVFWPSVYLTEQAAADEAQARQIITHELTHFRQGDMLWAFLRSLCLVIWWFDPLVWLAAALSRQDAELACDEGTIKALGEEARFEYGRTLLGMAKVGASPSDLLCGATTMTSGRKTLKERLERIARAPRPSLILALVVLLAAAAAVGCTYTGKASEPAPAMGAEVFRRYYQQIVEDSRGVNVSHVDLDMLDAMACSTVGTAVDTEELRIEVLGALFGGNTAEIVLRVTAKQLDTLLRDGKGIEKYYRFGDESALLGIFTLNRSFYSLSHNYIYSDTNDALAPNQFELRYQIIHSEPFAARTYTVPYWVEIPEDAEAKPFIIPLSDFGYYKQGRFVPLYEGDSEKEGDWNIAIDLDSVSDTGRKLTLDREITIGDYRFQMEDVQLTPLACTVRLDCLEDESVIDGHSAEIFDAYVTGYQGAGLSFSDGERPASDVYGGGAGRDYFVVFEFFVPIDPGDLTSLSLFGQDVSLSSGG